MHNCNGGWDVAEDSCTLGNIGALCESCDIYGYRTGTKFSHNG